MPSLFTSNEKVENKFGEEQEETPELGKPRDPSGKPDSTTGIPACCHHNPTTDGWSYQALRCCSWPSCVHHAAACWQVLLLRMVRVEGHALSLLLCQTSVCFVRLSFVVIRARSNDYEYFSVVLISELVSCAAHPSASAFILFVTNTRFLFLPRLFTLKQNQVST